MLQKDYEERVYAGVLGKVIGVYAGKPFEGWSYEKITEELGEINDYVHKSKKLRNAFDKMGLNLSLEGEEYPLVAVDDDISGGSSFIEISKYKSCKGRAFCCQMPQTPLLN